MVEDQINALLVELEKETSRVPQQSGEAAPRKVELEQDSVERKTAVDAGLDRSFASEYLDELIIAILFRCDEANGMDVIREFTHRFGVQFSPGTVYPHLHSLEEEGVLACRECVQTKEYRIDDQATAQEYIESSLTQLLVLSKLLGSVVSVHGD